MTPMYPPNSNQMPAPLGTLDELLESGDQAVTPVKAFIAHNLGNRTFLLSVPMYEFYRMSDVANERSKHGEAVTQRKLDPKHATKLAVYMLRGLVSAVVFKRETAKLAIPATFRDVEHRLGTQPYMSLQPIVANLRSCKPLGANIAAQKLITPSDELACFRVMLSQKDIMWVVDGQHRRKAMDLLFSFLDYVKTHHAYPKKGQSLYPAEVSTEFTPEHLLLWQECYEIARTHCSVQVELHLGLDIDAERQLFHDLNKLVKPVEASLALKFDGSNPVNAFIKTELIEPQWIRVTDKDRKNWQDDDGALAYKDLVAINAHLFLNKTNISGANSAMVEPKKLIAHDFWMSVVGIPGFGEAQAKQLTVAAQPVVLKALAKLTYDFAFGRGRDEKTLRKLLDGITDIDWSHDNPMWRFFELSKSERTEIGLDGLADYLPSDEDGKNRDIGSFQGSFMRFGAKHNDIFPLIGDMIRWKLNLPNRRQDSKAHAA